MHYKTRHRSSSSFITQLFHFEEHKVCYIIYFGIENNLVNFTRTSMNVMLKLSLTVRLLHKKERKIENITL